MTRTRSTHAARIAGWRKVISVSILVISALLPSFAEAQILPAGWAVGDVGSAPIPGVAAHATGIYTVSGSGSGIGGTADQFTFVYQRITGDSTVIARVDGLPLLGNAQAGVMIRQGLGAGTAHAAALVSRNDGITFVRRRSGGAATASTDVGSGNAPVWLRVDRRGSTMTASWSANGSSWTAIGADTVSATDVLYVGLAVASRTLVAPAQVLFSGVQTASLPDYGGPLPGGWTSQDIGGPGQAGAAAYDAGTFGIRGGGADIGGTWDQFHYAYAAGDGDVDIVARVRDLGDTNVQSKAGVMIRDSRPPTAPTPRRPAVFSASPDHDTLVTSHRLEVFVAGADPHTATPVATQNLGKPAVVNGEVTADITATINALSPGNYQATVSAVGSGGSARSSPAPFTR